VLVQEIERRTFRFAGLQVGSNETELTVTLMPRSVSSSHDYNW